MDVQEQADATAAARGVAASCGLPVEGAIVLHNSNKLTLRLLPCETVARIAPSSHQATSFELELAGRLAAAGSPVAVPEPRVEPRVYSGDGFAITFWTYYPSDSSDDVAAADYADTLAALHAGMRALDVRVPSVTDRVESALQLLNDPRQTPDLATRDRTLLIDTLQLLGRRVAAGGAQQLIHGEPHPGNLLATASGPLFIDFETCCRGPVEFDLAHAPEAVGEHYPGLDQALLRTCRMLMLAMIITWRWDRDDQLPNGRDRGNAWMRELETYLEIDRPGSTDR